MFNININRLFKRFMPHFLRKAVMIDYLAGAAKALKDVNDQFVILRDAILLKLSYTGQTIYLERLLNDNFDPVLRRIYIDNTNLQLFTYWRNVIENATPFYLENKAEAATPDYIGNVVELLAEDDFIINIPVSIVFDPINVNDDVARYAQAGVSWSIVTF